MAGLAAGLVTGRRELVAAGAGRRDRRRPLARRRARRSGSSPAGCWGPRWLAMASPTAAGLDLGDPRARSASASAADCEAASRRSRPAMSMGAVRARVPDGGGHLPVARGADAGPGHRAPAGEGAALPPTRRAGGARLARRREHVRARRLPQGTQEFHFGIEAVGVVACLAIVVWRKNLLLGLVVGVGVVALVVRDWASACSGSRVSPCGRRPRSRPAGSGRSVARRRPASPPAGCRAKSSPWTAATARRPPDRR